MKDAFSDSVPAVRALLVALGGVGLAKWWFDGRWILCVAVVVGLVVLGFVVEYVGEKFLPKHPVCSIYVMEWWILVPMAVGLGGSAALVVLAVELTLPETVKDPVLKETGGAIASGLSSFITAAFISNLGDKDKSGVGDRIKVRMRRHYKRAQAGLPDDVKVIQAGSAVEKLLNSNFYNGLEGWDRETRIARARGISEQL